MLKENLSKLIDLEELSAETFSLEGSVKKAKEILDVLREEDSVFDEQFEDDIWTFERHLFKGSTVIFNFSEMEMAARFRDYWSPSSVVLIKCWLAELLSSYYPEGIHQRWVMLIKIIEQTEFFNPAKANSFAESLRNYSPAVRKYLENKNQSTLDEMLGELKKDRSGISTVKSIIEIAFNFLTFSGIDSFHDYNQPLINIKKGLPKEVFARQLPSGKDVLKLDYCINRYFNKGINTNTRLLFAPILLWWKLTNIIPMRISEFCTIERFCIPPKYYRNCKISLPREKRTGNHRRVQVVDKLEITKDIYDLISEYIHHTETYGVSKTLVSYRAYKELNEYSNRNPSKKDEDYFNSNIFKSLLRKFYKDVVYGEYNETVERKVRPNDTRHFAFCSLLMQGLSPIEIARLGGHSTIEAQYHYSNHTEYFIDIEVDKLIKSFMNKDGEMKGVFEGNEITYDDIDKKSKNFPDKKIELLKMEIGWCKDELQRCESVECMLCKHWWIHPKELVKIRPVIQDKIRERKQKIVEMGNFLKNLNESFTETMVSDTDPNLYTTMETKAASIQEHLEEIARLEMLKGVDIDD
ncbi:hypothetical protein CWR48_18210 [Oceanobacillus arenosus]|uniref:Integrase n=1 Tax=Oceanobacillus arenosus TaxID=1229153 RepID=A0A3D8PJ53_9BACI|nr:site-specific integrase [Oceanobacillus arenosus]RDW16120.1 hypothetical protein CWR48_18210 [Oceanobacillus arenosus]